MPTYGVYSSDKVSEITAEKIAHTSGGTLGFFGTTPTTRADVTYAATITASWVTVSTHVGFAFGTSDQIVSLIGAVKDMQHILSRLGLWE